jgi:hypothetical protein
MNPNLKELARETMESGIQPEESKNLLVVLGYDRITAFDTRKREKDPLRKLYMQGGLCIHNGKLCYGEKQSGLPSDITAVIDFVSRETMTIVEREVKKLISHNGVLYDAGSYGLYETMDNYQVLEDRIWNVCSHQGKLFCSTRNAVINVSDNSRTEHDLKEELILDMCSYDGKLLVIFSGSREIYNYSDAKKFLDTQFQVYRMCCHEGQLYYVSREKHDFFEKPELDILFKNEEPVMTTFKSGVFGMHSVPRKLVGK